MCNSKQQRGLTGSRKSLFILSVAVLMLTLVACTSKEKRVALVIGNYDYTIAAKLNQKNVIADVYTITKALIKSGFDVNVNPDYDYYNFKTFKELQKIIDEFNERAKNADAAVFYYAGHGMQYEGVNYLLPTNVEINKLEDLDDYAIKLGNVLISAREDNQKRVNIIILNACRNNGFEKENRGLAEVLLPKETLIAFATSPGTVAYDNGYYAKAFLDIIEEFDGLRIQRVFDKISQKVGEQTSSESFIQVPMYNTNITGDFYFVKKKHAKITFTY